ncbi:MAG TPA: hypothetical protein VHL85_13025, partial [Burkholderiales bacterium]|nr:hypothetical protein [Burkholderiales bacterium]
MKLGLAVAILTLAFAAACGAFVWQPHIASFADDSVSYLLAAQSISPWHGASPIVLEAHRHEPPYPPLYPLVLALSAAAENLRLAHLLSALAIAAWLPLVYRLGRRWLQSSSAAAGAALATALVPALWINAMGILSEPLYGLILLAALCVLERDRMEPRALAALALLLCALVLTRSAGLVLVAAYGAWALTRRGRAWSELAALAMPALIAFAAYGLWVILRSSESSDSNAAIVIGGARALLSPEALGSIGRILARQATAIGQAWTGSLMVYWVPGRPVPVAVAALLGALALAGLGLRLARGKGDAWIAAGYLATFLVWPFYDQMGRFLFPVLPVLVLYAFDAVRHASARTGRPAVALGLLGFALLSLEIPALAFIGQRARIGGASAQIVDWYRTPGLDQARARAQVHLDLLADMDEIR